MPLFMFVILFGLTMDYHVFILSRIRERGRAGVPTKEAIVAASARSAGRGDQRGGDHGGGVLPVRHALGDEFKMFGVGMAVAILIDATVVRGVLMPAAMALLGDRNWYLPRWLSLAARRPGTPFH